MDVEKIEQLANEVDLRPYNQHYRISDFDSGIPEYNEFIISYANDYSTHSISQTQLLLNKKNSDIIGYITLCTDSIKLKQDEKEKHEMEKIPFNSLPALKIGKLAVDKRYLRRGYASFLILLARGIALDLNERGIACRFITVDADIDYDPSTVDLYLKNGFTYNETERKKTRMKSMRLDILNHEDVEHQAEADIV